MNASGTGAAAPTPVTENGITYLHGAPLTPAGQRDPSWILGQVGDSRGNLTFFADPLTEQNLIEKAIISETGRALLDPKYKDPAGQQQALWQGTVDFLKANPDIHLGDTLTEAQKASITQPILWYTNDNGVLTPELLLPPSQVDALTKQMGGMVLGQDIAISGDAVTNTGNLIASDKVLISAGGFLDNQRAVYDGWDAHLQDGGSIKAADIGILTLGDLDVAGGSMAASGTITLQSLMGDVNILSRRLASSGRKARPWLNGCRRSLA
ncbi:hypothetical protein GCM10007874_07930 [Labrys miyagiensis]|uniref:Filamentous hemagglutinin n=1 Tax=Labrys miyagiensis TaxID=346912 RepID=A0ABQ6CBK9_9HYPH|nr:hypothetical protein [Labrys miyagiensis]GLS17778.1 hypothetical protein GCM10007874_07930 [Labrys miyagiensis]